MTQTEKLLQQAREIAWRAFEEPTQETVMGLFMRLCEEVDQAAQSRQAQDSATVH